MQQLLNPKLATLPAEEVRAVIKEAKSFLKEQIREAVQIKELPKSLGGLLRLAEKIGIDVSKITLEQVIPEQGSANEKIKNLPLFRKMPAEIATQQLVENKQIVQNPAQKSDDAKKSSEPLRSLLHTPVEQANKTQAATAEQKLSTLHQQQPEQPLNTKKVDNSLAQKSPNSEAVTESIRTSASANETKQPAEAIKLPTAAVVNEQSKNVAAAIIPQSDMSKSQKKSESLRSAPAEVAVETASAKSELPAANPATAQQAPLSAVLGQLLRGDSDNASSATEGMRSETAAAEPKTHASALGIAKPDELGQKLLDAKQTIRHFAGEIREAVENYKPPFTRIKIRLNPVKLGEVDVTMIQRGNNVHINITSNNSAINTLAQHATELKTQLAQNGVSNTTMNFSNGNGNDQQQQQQQRQQQQQHAAEQYKHFDQLEDQQPLYTQLELIVPRYI